jgi:2-succinyl-5-enolpyruvyl-6-hydroxy-3-cyclohexene-1-carboxylate synthase
MSVRYAEYFWSAGQRNASIFANRGANGIDGTLGTAVGLAQDAEPCYLLTGDLAFLHDSNALLLAQQLRGSLTVILINNAGGGIFEHLPVAVIEPEFERYFATPQTVDFKTLCTAHGIVHHAVDSWQQFEHILEEPSARGLRVLELVTDRKADAQRLAAWQAAWLSDFEKRNFTS